ncbi:MAG: hypothetical protein PCFJNLEI_01347 [Verrucomicrobiae bacterium]|nr:hypothetical protein [Verrucomicrobiae bacterium]
MKFQQYALWTWPGAVRAGEPQRLVDRAKAARVDILIPYISRRGGTRLINGVETVDFPQYEDNLHALIAEAHRQGLKIHGCFDEMNIYPLMPADVQKLAQVRRDGSLGNVLCPANPTVREYILGDLRRVLKGFAYDGINLEDGYIFNPNTIYDPAHQLGTQFRTIPVCFCDWCKAHAPIDQLEWTAWRQQALTELVTALGALVRPFSAAARMPYRRAFYPPDVAHYDGWQYCQSRDAMMADWAAWPLDFVCPMTYFHDSRIVELQTRECQQLVPVEKLWMGLALGGASAEYSFGATKENPQYFNDAGKLAEQLELQLRLGQKQCVFFEHGQMRDEHIPVLARFHG